MLRNNRLRLPVPWAAMIGAAKLCLPRRSVKSSTPCIRTWWRRWVPLKTFEVRLFCHSNSWVPPTLQLQETPFSILFLYFIIILSCQKLTRHEDPFYRSCVYSMVHQCATCIECRWFVSPQGAGSLYARSLGSKAMNEDTVNIRWILNIGRYWKILEARSINNIRIIRHQYRINTTPFSDDFERQTSLLRRIERFVSGHFLFRKFMLHLRFVDPSFPQTKRSVYSQTYLQLEVRNTGMGTVQICGTPQELLAWTL